MNRSNSTATKGFTLLELTVVLVITSVAAGMGVTGLFRMTTYWNDLQAATRLNHEITQAFAALADDLEHVLSPQVSTVAFQGERRNTRNTIHHWRIAFEDDMMSFPIEVFNPITQQRNRMIVRYAIARGDGAPRLARFVSAYSEDGPTGMGSGSFVAQNISAMRINYFDGTAWRDEWDGPEAPRLVRVSLSVIDDYRPDRQLARTATFPVRIQ